MSEPKLVVRTAALPRNAGVKLRHPFNPASELRMVPLGDAAGMQRIGISIARVPPGKESFIPHAHLNHEEFVFVLEGRGKARVGDVEVAIGPGDFLGFPTDGTVHHLRNDGDVDLVFLQGGERGPIELTRFPTLGKLGVFRPGQPDVEFHDDATVERVSVTAWLAPSSDE
jgi:uncharacterized cupin superfamily protein